MLLSSNPRTANAGALSRDRDKRQEKGGEKRGGGVKSQKVAADKQKAKVRNRCGRENKEKKWQRDERGSQGKERFRNERLKSLSGIRDA